MENPQTAATPPSADARRAEYATAVEKNTEYYLQRFEAFDAGAPRAGWHWPAFFVPACWCLYRKLWGFGVLFALLPLIEFFILGMLLAILIPASPSTALAVAAIGGLVLIAPYIVFPVYANSLYWRRVRHWIADAESRFPGDASQRLARLERDGGTSIGPLIAIIIGGGVSLIGTLAGIAIPAYQDYTIRSQIAEGLNLATEVKAEVAYYWKNKNAWPGQSDLGGELPRGKYTADIGVQGGSIIITYGNKAHPGIASKRLVLQPGVTADQDVIWACGITALPEGVTPGDGPHGSEVPPKYLPKACRGP